jgi:serine-type D-Ala-D-Ala carboxypeptidase (penicillin-binding protein 5/6)
VKRSLLALICCSLALAASAAAGTRFGDVAATSFVVEDATTGEVLAARNPDREVAIASITKLMTVLVTLDHAKLTDVVSVDRAASEVGESAISLRAGDRLTVHDLIEAALIQSANNAADALALHVAGSYPAFAELMNAKARELGLEHTHFVRPDGLDTPGHYSTARDVTTLARAAMRIPFVRQTVRKQYDTIAGARALHTWNDLLATFPATIGVKTGHTSQAGWSQVAAARGRTVTVYAALLGSPDRYRRNADLTRLLVYGLSQYVIVEPIRRERAYATVALPYGRAPLALVAARPSRLVARVRRPLVERVVATAAAELPVRKGQRLGTVTISARGKVVARRPLVAARSVERPGVASRAGWYARRTVRNLLGWLT